MSLFNKIKEYFIFTRSEQKGVVALIIVIVIVLLIPPMYRWCSPQTIDNTGLYKEEIQKFKSSLVINTHTSPKSLVVKKYFKFDPNTVSVAELKDLGFTEKAIKSLINYRSKNGVFRSKEDLKKMYGLSPVFYQKVEAFINIMPKMVSNSVIKPEVVKKQDIIELNTVDSIQLLAIRGIGPVLSKRILKFRDNLGGFYSVLQIADVYGVNDSLVREMQSVCRVDTFLLKKININKALFSDLSRHPYISKYETLGILNYRKLQGCFKDKNQLKESKIFTDNSLKKVLPYLDFK